MGWQCVDNICIWGMAVVEAPSSTTLLAQSLSALIKGEVGFGSLIYPLSAAITTCPVLTLSTVLTTQVCASTYCSPFSPRCLNHTMIVMVEAAAVMAMERGTHSFTHHQKHHRRYWGFSRNTPAFLLLPDQNVGLEAIVCLR